ncbi:MAG: glycosyltransferase [Cyanobium sp.]
MTYFGMLCPAASGHLNPMTTLGHELRCRGHRVTLVGIADGRAAAEAPGLAFQSIGAESYPAGATRETLARIGELSGLGAFRATIRHLQASTQMLLREAPEALRAAGAEALLIDQVSFAGPTIAEVLDLPFVSVCCALMLNRDPVVPPLNTGWAYSPSRRARLRNELGHELIARLTAPITRVIVDHRAAAGLPPVPRGADPYSRLAQISQQPAEFEFPRRSLPACFHFCGPFADPASRPPAPFPWERLSGQPLIYASLGTIQNRLLGLFETIAAACRDLDVQLVIALGGGCVPEDLPPLPGDPLVVGFAPQLELLRRAALTITHAGMITVLELLAEGVPMVAIPIANDQPGVGARLAWSGSGAVVPLKRLSAARLRAAIERVLQEDSYRAEALRLQAAIRRAGGVSRAADVVEPAVASGQPVLR